MGFFILILEAIKHFFQRLARFFTGAPQPVAQSASSPQSTSAVTQPIALSDSIPVADPVSNTSSPSSFLSKQKALDKKADKPLVHKLNPNNPIFHPSVFKPPVYNKTPSSSEPPTYVEALKMPSFSYKPPTYVEAVLKTPSVFYQAPEYQEYTELGAVADPRAGINTSDHTYQSVQVIAKHPDGTNLFSIQGSTWNLLNKCKSKKDNGNLYKNNPWNYSETDDAYLSRKERQFEKILKIISKPGQDFMFLQEIDCLTNPKVVQECNEEKLKVLREKFVRELRAMGWSLITSPKGQKRLTTLYNTKTLEVGPKESVLNGEGFTGQFRHKLSQQAVSLVNLHLDYSKAYSDAIDSYQQAEMNVGRFTIMAGDTNHAPNGITGLLHHQRYATNIEGNDEGKNITDTDNHGNKKCYDGFFVSPTLNTKVEVIEKEAEIFQFHKVSKQFLVYPFNPEGQMVPHYHSEVGKPCQLKSTVSQRAVG